eukprot:19296-Heterococcus_DN1.PRE.1
MSSNRVMHQVRILQAVTCARGAWMFAGAQVRYYLPLLAVASGRDELTHADDEIALKKLPTVIRAGRHCILSLGGAFLRSLQLCQVVQ